MYPVSASPQQVSNARVSLSKVHPTFFKLAIVFISIAVVTAIILTAIASYSKEAYESYDYAKIEREGEITQGKSIKTNYTTTVNSRHPKIIQYTYTNNGKEVAALFKTLSPGPVDKLSEGDAIDVKVLKNESKIANLEPFSFPFYIFYIIPVVFLLVGSGFFIALMAKNRKGSNGLTIASAY